MRLLPISVPYQKKNGRYARKARGNKDTVVLSSTKFFGKIKLTCLISPQLVVLSAEKAYECEA